MNDHTLKPLLVPKMPRASNSKVVRACKSALLGALLLPYIAFAYTSPGKPQGFVNDYAHVLTPDQVGSLDASLVQFEQQTSNEIAVVTVPTTGDDTIEDYAAALFKEWGIGKKVHDNGVLLLIAVDDRKMRIEVGYGLEGALTDAMSSDIIRNILAPAFKQNDFSGGISKAVEAIEQATKGEYTPKGNNPGGFSDYLFIIIFAAAHILLWFASILGRSKSWWAGGVVGAVIAIIAWIFFGLVIGIIALVILIPFGLLFDFIVSSVFARHQALGLRPPWWIGGTRIGGGGRGISGFGGFGGGGSGGGGASGGW